MSLPEGHLPRKGDIVLIKARAKRDSRPGDDLPHYFEIVGHEHQSFFPDKDDQCLHSLYSRNWNIGDRVRVIAWPDTAGEVIAIHGEWMWVVINAGENSGAMLTYSGNELDLAPAEKPGMVAIGEAIAIDYPNQPPPAPQRRVGDDEEIAF
jgi:hypothetical protein